jgi:serine/threonine protein kinase
MPSPEKRPTGALVQMFSWRASKKTQLKQHVLGSEEQQKQWRDKNTSQKTTDSSKSMGCFVLQGDQGKIMGASVSKSATPTVTNAESNANRFLKTTLPCRPIAMLDRREIQVGILLGEGAFCEVFEVESITLLPMDRLRAPSASAAISEQTHRRCRQAFANAPVRRNSGAAKYALKQISTKTPLVPGGVQHLNAAMDLFSETNFLCRLDHPNIIKVHATAMDSVAAFEQELYKSMFLISDCMAGTLYQLLNEWKKSELVSKRRTDPQLLAKKTRYALQIVSALEYLHARRIIYRDLKPANVGYLLAFSNSNSASSGGSSSNNNNVDSHVGTIQLFDLGFCRELPDSTQEHDEKELFRMSSVGSPSYMAPEVKGDDSNAGIGLYNLKADMYSFALVFYELLILEKPCLNKARKWYSKSKPKKLKLLPESLQELLLGTWHCSLDERWTSRQTRARLEIILQELEGDDEGAIHN